MLTPEERALLAAARNLDELDALLESFYEAGKLTKEEVLSLWDEFSPGLEEVAVGAPLVTGGGQNLSLGEQLGEIGEQLWRAPGELRELLLPTRRGMPPATPARAAPLIVSQGGTVATAPGPLDQYLNDPDIMASLADYTSLSDKSDPTSLARLIADLLTGGIIPDEATAGAIYTRIAGITSGELTAATKALNDLMLFEGTEYAATPEQIKAARKRIDVASATLGQKAAMAVREGVSQNAIAQGKLEATSAQRQYEAEVQRVEDLNLIEQAKYKYALGEQKAAKEAERAAINAPIIQANKDVYLPGLKTYLQQAVQSGAITQEQADSQYSWEDYAIGQGYNLQDLPNYANLKGMGWVRTPEQKMAGEAEALVDIINQRNRAQEASGLLARQEMFEQSEKAGLDQLIDEYRRRNAFLAREAERPALPRAGDVAEQFLSTIGAPRFREFIRSKLGEIAEQTAGARAEWWQRKQPVQPMAEPAPAPVPTFESLLAGARADVRERGDILRAGQLGASTAFLPGGVQAQEYWTGQLPYATEQKGLSETRLADLLALGQEGYFAQQRALIPGERRPLELKPTTEEDPFLTEIKRKYGDKLGFVAEWLSLAPETRGYQKSRFAPRVQFRGF